MDDFPACHASVQGGVFGLFERISLTFWLWNWGFPHRRLGRYKLAIWIMNQDCQAFKSLMTLVIRGAMVCTHTPADLQKSRINNINCRLVNLTQASGSIHCNQNYRIVDQVIQVNKIFITKDLLIKFLKWYFWQTFFQMNVPQKKKNIMEKNQVDETLQPMHCDIHRCITLVDDSGISVGRHGYVTCIFMYPYTRWAPSLVEKNGVTWIRYKPLKNGRKYMGKLGEFHPTYRSYFHPIYN